MKRLPRTLYESAESADEIEERIQQRELDSRQVPSDTNEHRRIMREIAKLRMRADVKRWLWGGPAKRRA